LVAPWGGADGSACPAADQRQYSTSFLNVLRFGVASLLWAKRPGSSVGGNGPGLPASSPVSAAAPAGCGQALSSPPARPLMLGEVAASDIRVA
jgi:hypothetical protein